MKRSPIYTGILIFALLLAACAPATTAAPPTQPPTLPPTAPPTQPPTPTPLPPTDTPEPPTATPAPIVLEISSPEGSLSLTMEDLRALPAQEGQAGLKSSTGRIYPPQQYKGVALSDLADLVGGLSADLGVSVVAKDGYAMTLSTEQITQGNFIVYDPATGDEKTIDEPLTVIVAYEREGQPIREDEEGPLRLVVISPKNNQVVDGHWSVKWTSRIELKPMGAEWNLALSGVIDDVVDRNSFQSCAAPGCHQAAWSDDQAQQWVGVPLWLLAGRVDDEIKHDGPAFYQALADAGYNIELVAADGYSVVLESDNVSRNDKWLLAYQVNENPLPDKYFPLRLVGEGLDKGQMVGQVAQINLLIDEAVVAQLATAAAPEPTPTAQPLPPVVGADLVVFGAVTQVLALDESDLRAMQVVQVSAEHPKKGLQDYEGVLLSTLLEMAGPKEGASQLALIASDGYSVEIELAQVSACQECLVAFSETPGKFNLVMPGLESSFWVKEIVQIEIR
ncbi:MAG: molybdopterin-dependent oxidoreductase [Anaerolineales bacterium]|nr:molybdopterin-dependent oxidoreductase [Anaerolineales bacterium]